MLALPMRSIFHDPVSEGFEKVQFHFWKMKAHGTETPGTLSLSKGGAMHGLPRLPSGQVQW
jgi:hypothetical protein